MKSREKSSSHVLFLWLPAVVALRGDCQVEAAAVEVVDLEMRSVSVES